MDDDRRPALRKRLAADPPLRSMIDEVCQMAQLGPQGLVPTMTGDPETDAIFAVLDAEHVANWQRDLEGFAATQSQTDYERWWAWIRFGGGLTS